MTREGIFEYGEDTEEFLKSQINWRPKTLNYITTIAREKYARQIDRSTVKRILLLLQKRKQIDNFKIGKVTLWADKKTVRNRK